jgi:hypothetical protein
MPIIEAVPYAGEVIDASISQFRCFAPILNNPPAFGSFVRIGQVSQPDPFEPPKPENGAVYGLVFQANTSSQDPNRRPSAFGLEREELEREQPQIFELLATEFACLIVAHVEDGQIRGAVPLKPPILHSRVFEAAPEEVELLTNSFSFLRSMLNIPDCSQADELMAATIRTACKCHKLDPDYAVRAGKELALLLREDYDRLDFILRKIGPA